MNLEEQLWDLLWLLVLLFSSLILHCIPTIQPHPKLNLIATFSILIKGKLADDNLESSSMSWSVSSNRSKYNGIDDWVIELEGEINRAGSYEFYLEYTSPEDASQHQQTKSTSQRLGLDASPSTTRSPTVRSYTRTFNVEPQLQLNGEILELGKRTFLNDQYSYKKDDPLLILRRSNMGQ